ncbi:GNAT family N-acetyltransferase [Povalibacter sp.]|uniref:GNAT family N-acetyltransferase n=1 Tax=Povalibacter sp. TaxID=1962978 RepID=UPI0032C23256
MKESSRTCMTARLHLRPIDPNDRDLFCELHTSVRVMQFIGSPLTESQAIRKFGKALQMTRERRRHLRFYAIVERHTDKPIGICGLIRSRSQTGLEIGIMLHERWQGRGYGREAVWALVEQTLRRGPVQRIFATTDARNAPCAGMFRGLGFQQQPGDGNARKTLWEISRESMAKTPATAQQKGNNHSDGMKFQC